LFCVDLLNDIHRSVLSKKAVTGLLTISFQFMTKFF
jgi:hypothetical protein